MSGNMCTKAEVKEVVDDSLKGIVAIQAGIATSILKIEASLGNLPCNLYNEKILKLQFEHEAAEKEMDSLRESRTILFDRVRELEDGGSIKIKWVATILITGAVSAAFAILVYKLTRG